MGSRISFRPRARGCAEAGPIDSYTYGYGESGATYLEPRLAFVPGEPWDHTGPPTAGSVYVGQGTTYPLRVTAAQLFELLYRVRDSRFSGNIRATDHPSGGPTTIDLAFSAAAPSATNYQDPDPITGDNPCVQRAWADAAGNLTDETDIWTKTLLTPTEDPAERLFTGFGAIPLSFFYNHRSSNGFATYAKWDDGGGAVSPPAAYGPYSLYDSTDYFSAEVDVSFNGRVAFVDNAGDADLFNPANELWLGVIFSAGGDDGLFLYPIGFSTLAPEFDFSSGPISTPDLAGGVVIALSSENLLLDLWSLYPATLTGGLTITATEWWPYAKPGGGDFWTPGTGALAP